MPIVYPLTPPAGKRMSVEWMPRSVVALSASSFTLQTQAQAHAGQIWLARVKLVPMSRADAEQWIAFLLSLNGAQGTFHLGDSVGTSPRGSGSGTPLVNGASQTGQALVTDGWTASANGVLLKGDWIQLGSGLTRRIYRVLNDVNANGLGQATIDIWPRLRESPADNEPLVLSNTAGTFRLLSNEMDYSIDNAQNYGLEFDVGEAL